MCSYVSRDLGHLHRLSYIGGGALVKCYGVEGESRESRGRAVLVIYF